MTFLTPNQQLQTIEEKFHLALFGSKMFVCLGFYGTFSTNRLYRAIKVEKYIT